MKTPALLRNAWAAFCLGLGLIGLRAAERFPFVIPGDDATPSATDMSHLSPRTAGADGFVRIRDGHFYTDSGRLRIWGVNTCFGANFPPHDIAEKVAAHLAKLGVNGVRMHHHDGSAAPRGIWDGYRESRRLLDPGQLDRQDYFLDQLHRHGIYVNLNLHVSRTFNETEGFLSRGLPREVRYDKYLLYFEPRMRRLFKAFCREYLTHYNPYRKRRRVDDPGIAMIEITNENAFSQRGPELAARLPDPYRSEFQRQWNQWLRKHYSSTAELKRAWGAGIEPLQAPIADSQAWTRGLGAWRLHQSRMRPLRPRPGQPGPTGQPNALRIEIPTAAEQVHEHELMLTDLKLQGAQTYTLSFWVRADRPRSLSVDVSRQGPTSWAPLGLRATVQVQTNWQRVVEVFRTPGDVPDRSRICFKFGGDATAFSLAELTLRPGGEFVVLPDGQSLEQQNVDIPTRRWAEPARRDAYAFMVEVEKGFIRDVMHYLKNDLGVRVPITASQITYHGAAIVAETCDYADVHAYWEHPRFPGRPWDPRNWYIPNTPMEKAPDADRLLSRAPWRLLDRPFTLSEWNIPDPNDYAASVVPFAAMVAGLQDWDAVFFFQYHSSHEDWFADHIRGYFSFNGQPVKLALLTACAPMFRRGDLAPPAQTLAGTFNEPLPATLGLRYRIGIDPRASLPGKAPLPQTRLLTSPDGNVSWDARDPEHAFAKIHTPASCAVWGLIGGQSFDFGNVRLRVDTVERNYAVVVITSLDGRPIERSEHLLLTAVGSAQNIGMEWNAQRTSVGNRWGHGPTQVNGVPLELQLPFEIHEVHSLDGRGHVQGTVKLRERNRVQVGPEYRTLWYEIVRKRSAD